MRHLFFCVLIVWAHACVFAQDTNSVVVDRIYFEGNNKTKNHILLREITFQAGDTVQNIIAELEESTTNLFNTRLFHYVRYKINTHLKKIEITFYVQERWYLWPIPIFEWADPNLATWIRRKEIDYINYGIQIKQRNLRGLNQQLKVKIRLGVREQYGLTYTFPQVGRNKVLGGYLESSFFRQKEIHQYLNDYQYIDFIADKYIYHEGRAFAGVTWRPKMHSTHLFTTGYRKFVYNNSITHIFEEDVKKNNTYAILGYTFNYFEGDYIVYPLNGNKFNIQSEIGFGSSMYAFTDIQYGFHRKLLHRVTFSYGANAFFSFTKQYPYFLFTGQGKTWYIRGFEDYIYQQDMLLLNRLQFKYTLLEKQDFEIKQIHSNKFNSPYLRIFINAFAEVGYGTNYIREYAEVHPISIGCGIDFLTYYDWVGRFEFTYNNRKEMLLNIHWGYIF